MGVPVDESGAGTPERWDAQGISGHNDLVGASLKALYSAVEQEPVPALFIELLGRLEQAESRQSGSDNNAPGDAST